MEKHFNLFLVLVIINLLSSYQNPISFTISIDFNSNSEGLYINNVNEIETSPCQKWIPSLFIPTLLISFIHKIPKGDDISGTSFNLNLPFYLKNKIFKVSLIDNVPFLKPEYSGSLMKAVLESFDQCYFGISPGFDNAEHLEEKYYVLNKLKNLTLIKEKIFSFEKWDSEINPKSKFYLGEFNEIFSSNKGNIGTCENYPNDAHWGCSFKKMIFNDINIPLTDEDGNLYKIYFASETHNLIFPKSFEKTFADQTNNSCQIESNNYLKCKNYFDNSKYLPLQLTEGNDNFIITGEIDNLNRYSSYEESNKDLVRITFDEKISYIILPLIVFKNFDIQFNAEKGQISFYTDNSTILSVKKKVNESSFSVGLFFIIILIILLILALGIGFHMFFIKKKRCVERSINQFSKFEDEESYNNINEKKVF